MSRIQLALNVEDLDAAVDFYRKLFDVEPHKRRPGYANFAVDEPPLKLVLFEGAAPAGTINHLGVEVTTPEEVTDTAERFALAELAPSDVSESEVCCYATQDKVWVTGPDSTRWEVYAVTDDAPEEAVTAAPACCA